MTGRTPAEVLMGRAPRPRLSLVHPCLSNTLSAKAEMKVGSTPLRNFDEGQEVLVCHHCPNTKAKILAWLGPLNYEVSIDGQTRMAHVDYLLPSSREKDEAVGYEQNHKEEESDNSASATETETSSHRSLRSANKVQNTEY